MSLLQKTDDLSISRLRQLHAEKVVRLHAEKLVLLPLLGGVIASIIYLVGALNRLPGAEPPPAALVSEDHQLPGGPAQ